MRAARSANGTVSVDLRPLAVGRGKFRVEIKLTSGKRSQTVKRTVKVGKDGTLPRIAGSLAKATAKCTVTLTVRKRAGSIGAGTPPRRSCWPDERSQDRVRVPIIQASR